MGSQPYAGLRKFQLISANKLKVTHQAIVTHEIIQSELLGTTHMVAVIMLSQPELSEPEIQSEG
jgi:hypothetical protein